MKTPYELFHVECGKGWENLINPLLLECQEKGYHVAQVKEKYGGLRFYVMGCPEEFWEKIDKAEELSYKICEVCGEPGVLRSGGWVQTLCNTHAEGREPYENPNI